MQTSKIALALVIALGAVGCGGDDELITTDGETLEPQPDGGTVDPPDAGDVPDEPDAAPPPDAPAGMACPGVEGELGAGVKTWQSVDDGDTVYLYRGPQGGYYIPLSVRAKGLDPSDVHVCYVESFVVDGKIFGQGCWRVKLTNDLGDGRFERVGMHGLVSDEYWVTPAKIRGKDVKVEATVTDKHGCQFKDGWTVHVHEEQGQ